MRVTKEDLIITSRESIINALSNYPYDLRSYLLEIVSNGEITSDVFESSLYWIGILAYKDNNGKVRKLSSKEYEKLLFSTDFKVRHSYSNKPFYGEDYFLKDEFSKTEPIFAQKYYMFSIILSHILALENDFLDAPEYLMLISSIPDQKEIVKPKYKNKKSIYPCNMPDMKFEELLEYRKL